MGTYYITEVQHTHPEMHPYKVILHSDWSSYYKTFGNMKQLDEFAKLLGFNYTLVDTWNNGILGKCNKYGLSHLIHDPHDGSFWDLSTLPPGAKKVTLMDNGHNITCYFINDGEVIYVYRPNPNVKELHREY